jgi:Protein of unknown function (DUF1641)
MDTQTNEISVEGSMSTDILDPHSRTMSDATLARLEALLAKTDPLMAGQRLNHLVDWLSVLADAEELVDSSVIENLVQNADEAIGAVWTAGNAVRLASSQIGQMETPPSLVGLLRMTRRPEVRRGLAFMLLTLETLGRSTASIRSEPTESGK